MENKAYTYSEFYFDSTIDDQKIFTRLYEPINNVKAVLQIVHGMAEHTGLYEKFCEFLAENGIVCVLDDHLGHGKSVLKGEDYGHFFGDINNLVKDEKKLSSIITNKYPNVPFFIMGHSMGSFIVRDFVVKYPGKAKAAIIMGTSAGMPSMLWNAEKMVLDSIIKTKGEKHKSNFVYETSLGAFKKAFSESRYAWVTSLETEQERFSKDPLCGFPLTVGSYKSMGNLLSEINKKEWFENVPKKMGLLLISGEKDAVGDMGKGIRSIYKKLVYTCHRVKMILYPELRHGLVYEKHTEKTFSDILFFLENEIARNSVKK